MVEMWILRSKLGLQVLGAHITDRQSSAADTIQMPSHAETGQEPRSKIASITLKSALRSTTSSPCTNSPLERIFCDNHWEWKYSMKNHVDTLHTGAVRMRKGDQVGQKFLKRIVVSEDEKTAVKASLQKDLK